MRALAPVLVATAVLAATACSSTVDSGEGTFGQPSCSGAKAVHPDGSGFCYLRPAGTRKPDSVSFERHKFVSGSLVSQHNVVIVGLLAIDPAYNQLSDDRLLEQVTEEVQSTSGETTFDTGSGRISKAPEGRVLGYNAKQGGDPVAVNLIFVKDMIIQVNCRWKDADRKDAVLNACSSVLATMRAAD